MKLYRIIVISLLAIALFIAAYCVIPFVTWVFGGSFLGVAQSIPYILFGGMFNIIMVGMLIHDSVDGNDFTFKN